MCTRGDVFSVPRAYIIRKTMYIIIILAACTRVLSYYTMVIQCFGPSPINLSIRDNRNRFFFSVLTKANLHRAPLPLFFFRVTDGTRNYRHHHHHLHGYNTTLIFHLFFFSSTSIIIFLNYFPPVYFFPFFFFQGLLSYAEFNCVVSIFCVRTLHVGTTALICTSIESVNLYT